mmetsp:Transcript_58115/g.180541  ORF Transcript_58115/g.180541 Transcript_58115/m.180541 type:complete len:395 (+) Transcript_58115:1422-2606(+)
MVHRVLGPQGVQQDAPRGPQGQLCHGGPGDGVGRGRARQVGPELGALREVQRCQLVWRPRRLRPRDQRRLQVPRGLLPARGNLRQGELAHPQPCPLGRLRHPGRLGYDPARPGDPCRGGHQDCRTAHLRPWRHFGPGAPARAGGRAAGAGRPRRRPVAGAAARGRDDDRRGRPHGAGLGEHPPENGGCRYARRHSEGVCQGPGRPRGEARPPGLPRPARAGRAGLRCHPPAPGGRGLPSLPRARRRRHGPGLQAAQRRRAQRRRAADALPEALRPRPRAGRPKVPGEGQGPAEAEHEEDTDHPAEAGARLEQAAGRHRALGARPEALGEPGADGGPRLSLGEGGCQGRPFRGRLPLSGRAGRQAARPACMPACLPGTPQVRASHSCSGGETKTA